MTNPTHQPHDESIFASVVMDLLNPSLDEIDAADNLTDDLCREGPMKSQHWRDVLRFAQQSLASILRLQEKCKPGIDALSKAKLNEGTPVWKRRNDVLARWQRLSKLDGATKFSTAKAARAVELLQLSERAEEARLKVEETHRAKLQAQDRHARELAELEELYDSEHHAASCLAEDQARAEEREAEERAKDSYSWPKFLRGEPAKSVTTDATATN